MYNIINIAERVIFINRTLKTAAVFLAAAICLSGCGQKSEADVYAMRENLDAQTVAEEMGIGINLGNTFEAYYSDDANLNGFSQVVGDGKMSDYEKCWGAVETTREIIDGMAESGFKTVRIPVFWGNGMADGTDFAVNPELLERVEEVVKWALEDGLYAVVNMHHYDERLIMFLDEDEAVHAAERVWTQVAEHFKDYGDHLVFEGYNEYLGGCREGENLSDDERYEYTNRMNQTFVDAVRATGGNNSERVLIASGYNTNIDKTTAFRFKMPQDSVPDRLMVSVHYIDNAMYWSKQIGGETWHSYILQQCELLKNAFTANGIPVFVGETTASYDGQMVADPAYGTSQECIRELVKIAKEDYGFVPVFWDTHHDDGTAFYDRVKCRVTDSVNRGTVERLGE